jgi:peptide chain release factor subunit 1
MLSTEKVTRFYGCKLTTTNSAKQHKLRKLIAELSDKRGRTKDFISLYIPKNATIEEIIAKVKNDADTITSKSKNESDLLEETAKNLIKQLKQQKENLENGLALFAGTFVANGSESLIIEELVPPKPITSYICVINDHFDLEPLRDMLRDQRVIGLIAVDSKEASFGIVSGEKVELIESISSGIPGKSGKGGQSQRRYERERDMEISNFFHRVAEHAAKAFLDSLKATQVIIGGPGQTKNDFYKGDYLNYQLKNAVIKLVDTQSACNDGIREMFEKSNQELTNVCGPEEKRTMERLSVELNKQEGLAITGLDPVLDGLKRGSVEVALVSDSSDLIETGLTCKKCGLLKTKIINKKNAAELKAIISTPCERCHAVEYELVEKDMVDVLEDAASLTDARVEVIFTESDEKTKLKALGGFAALLRYKSG